MFGRLRRPASVLEFAARRVRGPRPRRHVEVGGPLAVRLDVDRERQPGLVDLAPAPSPRSHVSRRNVSRS